MQLIIGILLSISICSHGAIKNQIVKNEKTTATIQAMVHEKELIEDVIEKEKRPLSASRKQALSPLYSDLITLAKSQAEPLKMRWSSLMLALEIDANKASKDVLQFFDSSDWFMRNAALLAIEKIDTKLALVKARELINDKALVVRSAAVEILTKNGNSQDREILWKELFHERNYKGQSSLWIRGQIVEFLNTKPQPNEIQKFAKLLFDRDKKTSKSIIPSLEKLTSMNFGQTDKSVRSWQQFVKNENLIEVR